MGMRYFSEYAGKVYAILNCWKRKSEKDAMIALPLNTRELRLYHRLKDNGKSDSTVFNTLFPREIPLSSDDQSVQPAKRTSDAEKQKVEIDIRELNKKQLIHLILREMQTTLKSLPRMTKTDLQKILLIVKQRQNHEGS